MFLKQKKHFHQTMIAYRFENFVPSSSIKATDAFLLINSVLGFLPND
jgi:hypothetical protein